MSHIYPACRFDSVVVGRFSLPSLAIGEVTMSGKQMCLAACVANAVCTHVSYKHISGKCLLFPETAAVDQSSDEMMNTYMLVHFGVPTDCVPPTAGISRSKDVMFILPESNLKEIPNTQSKGGYFETRLSIIRTEKGQQQNLYQKLHPALSEVNSTISKFLRAAIVFVNHVEPTMGENTPLLGPYQPASHRSKVDALF